MKKKTMTLRERTDSFGMLASDKVTLAIATWKYITLINIIIGGWMGYNLIAKNPFDPYPFILLNLFLSWIAANTPSLIMMSTTRQDSSDRAKIDQSLNIDKATYKHTKFLVAQIKHLNEQQELLESIIHDLIEEKHEDDGE